MSFQHTWPPEPGVLESLKEIAAVSGRRERLVMGKKRKPSKKKPYPVSVLSPQQEIQLKALLANPKDIDLENLNEKISTPEIAQALVERLSANEPDAINILLALKDAFPQRIVQKAIKKTIFRFKQKGLSHPELEPAKGSHFFVKGVERSEPSVYLGPIDGTGSRGVFLVLPHLPKGVDVGMGVANDEKGILQFLYGRYTKKRMKEVREIFFSNFSHAVETSLSHVATILERAYQDSGQTLGKQAGDYLKLRPWILNNVSFLEEAAIFDLISPDSISEEALTASQIDRLLGHELMENWIIGPEKMGPVLEGIQKARESRILVSEAQKREQIEEVKKNAIHEIYSEEQCLRVKARLEEMSYVFFKLDEREMSSFCVAAARSVAAEGSPSWINPFLEAIMEHSLAFYEKVMGARGKSPDGIVDNSSPRIVIP